jgi:hypothetical protein
MKRAFQEVIDCGKRPRRLQGQPAKGSEARRLCFALLLPLFCLRMSLFASVLCTLEDILPDRGLLTLFGGGHTLQRLSGEIAYIFYDHP